jgi:hypothetical protein
VFRDFIYLDIERVQSIIAQLQEGLLTEIVAGESKELSGKFGLSAGIVSQFLPIGLSAEKRNINDTQSSKILHDHAFNLAHDSLSDQSYLIDASYYDLSQEPIPDSAFVLIKGDAKIFDYSTFQNIASHEKQLNEIFPSTPEGENRQQRRKQSKKNKQPKKNDSVFGEIKVLVDAFFKDAIQVRVTNHHGISFVGPLSREHLREDIYNLIFKYGSKLQGQWAMLAAVTRVTSNPSLNSEMEFAAETLEDLDSSDIQSGSDVLNEVLDMMNSLQEFISSAAYPDITVSPIALYREIHPSERSAESV